MVEVASAAWLVGDGKIWLELNYGWRDRLYRIVAYPSSTDMLGLAGLPDGHRSAVAAVTLYSAQRPLFCLAIPPILFPTVIRSLAGAGSARCIERAGRWSRRRASHAMSAARRAARPKILVIDIGGSNVDCLRSGQATRRKFTSGPGLTAQQMVDGVLEFTSDWHFDRVSIGNPGVVRHSAPAKEPHHLAPGEVGFDFAAAFVGGCRLWDEPLPARSWNSWKELS